MKEYFELISKAIEDHTSEWSDTTTALVVLFIILAGWIIKKVIEHVVPLMFDSIRQRRKTYQDNYKMERAVRDFTSNVLANGWISSIPSLSEFKINTSLEQAFVPPRIKTQEQNSISVSEIITKSNTLLITGSPGIGKTTLARMIAIAYATDRTNEIFAFKESRLPFYLELKRVDDTLAPIHETLSLHYKIDITSEFILKRLESGTCVVILDGLDECGDEKRRADVIEWIHAMSSAYSDCRWIITSRMNATNILTLPNAVRCSLLDLSPEQVEHLINNWKLNHNPASPNHDLAQTLNSQEYQSLQPHLSNPLLLTIIIVLSHSGINIPNSRSQIVKLFISVVANEWDGIKRLTDIEDDSRIRILRKIALHVMKHKNDNNSFNLLDDENKSIINELTNSEDIVSFPALFNFLADRTGLLRKVSDNKYEFSNRSILECLAALEVNQSGQFEALLCDVDPGYWVETLSFSACFAQNPANYFAALQKNKGRPEITCRLLSSIILENAQAKQDTKLLGLLQKDLIHAFKKLIERSNEESIDPFVYRISYSAVGKPLIDILTSAEQSAISAFTLIGKNNNREFSQHSSARTFIAIDSEASIKALLDILGEHIQRRLHLSEEKQKTNCDAVIGFYLDTLSYSKNTFTTKNLLMFLCDANIHSFNYSLRPKIRNTLTKQGTIILDICKDFLSSQELSDEHRIEVYSVLAALKLPDWSKFIIKGISGFPPRLQSVLTQNISDEAIKILYIDTFSDKKKVYAAYIKPALDFLLSATVIFLIWPVMLCVMIVIKIDSPGPAIYRYRVVGRGGQPVSIHKFRTMIVSEITTGAQWAKQNDSRITRSGSFLRKTGLDELPILFDVLIGKISTIGPRPIHFSQYEQVKFTSDDIIESRLLELKPGVTGLSQLERVHGTTELETSRRHIDLVYRDQCSFTLDSKILLKTIFEGILGRNAY